MNLNTLHDAFTTLEERADAVHAAPPDFTVSVSPARTGVARFAAPAAAVAAVVTVAAGVTVWQTSHHSGHGAAPQPAAHGPSSPSPAPSSSRPTHARSNRYQPPDTVADLEAKTVAVLNGIATITVDPTRSGGCSDTPPSHAPGRVVVRGSDGTTLTSAPPPPVQGSADEGCSGSSIAGTLTSDGQSGGFDLNVYASSPGKALCDSDTECSVHPYAGGSLAVGSWHDPNTPGGVTYQVDFVRGDGANVLIHLSTLADPKGESHVTASKLPLTTQQLIAFVTSAKW